MNLINVAKELTTAAREYPNPAVALEAYNKGIKLFDLSIDRCMLPSFIAKFQHLENVELLPPPFFLVDEDRRSVADLTLKKSGNVYESRLQ